MDVNIIKINGEVEVYEFCTVLDLDAKIMKIIEDFGINKFDSAEICLATGRVYLKVATAIY